METGYFFAGIFRDFTWFNHKKFGKHMYPTVPYQGKHMYQPYRTMCSWNLAKPSTCLGPSSISRRVESLKEVPSHRRHRNFRWKMMIPPWFSTSMLNSDVENLQHVTISIFKIIQNLMGREFDTTITTQSITKNKLIPQWKTPLKKSINGDKHKSIPLIS